VYSKRERAVSVHPKSHFNLHLKDFSRFSLTVHGKRVRNKWAATVHKKKDL